LVRLPGVAVEPSVLPALYPIAVLLPPVVLFRSAFIPVATLLLPVVLFIKVW